MIPPFFDIHSKDGAKPRLQSSRLGHTPHLNHREDSPPPQPTPSEYMLHPHPLGQNAFNQLSIWAYLAIAFILLAVATVFAYLLFTCYRSGKSRQPEIWVPRPRVSRLGSNGNMVRQGDKLSGVGEKEKLGSTRVGRSVLGLKGFGFGHGRKLSESEANTIRLSHLTASQSSLSDTKKTYFDVEDNYLSSPTLAHTKKGSAMYTPFHLPPPFISPRPERTDGRKTNHGRTQRAPASPSPLAGSISSPPPTSVGLGAPRRGSDKEPTVGFGLSDVQFARPLNPFISPSTAHRGFWNDPKLSPIRGSVITTNPNTDDGFDKDLQAL